MELGKPLDDGDVDTWFVEEVLPLEPMLTRLLRHHWHDNDEISDLRQEAYVRIYEAAKRERPSPVKPFLVVIARNLIIDRLRRKNVVSIETMADAGWAGIAENTPSPEDRVSARQDLRRMQWALDQLPPRCREVILLRRVQGYSQREVARMMGIREETVENQVVKGMRMLADMVSDRRGTLVTGARRLGWRRHD